MKKVIFIVAIAFMLVSFASCKKEYTCTCKGTTLTEISYTLGIITKKDAKAQCDLKQTAAKAADATASCDLE